MNVRGGAECLVDVGRNKAGVSLAENLERERERFQDSGDLLYDRSDA